MTRILPWISCCGDDAGEDRSQQLFYQTGKVVFIHVEFLFPCLSGALPDPGLPRHPTRHHNKLRTETHEVISGELSLNKAKAEAEKRGIGLETLFVEVCQNYAKQIADDTGRPKLLMCKLPDVTNDTTSLRFKAPDSIWRITTNDPALASRFVSEALDRRFGDWR